MIATRKRTKPSLSRETRSNPASFVPIDASKTASIKYKLRYILNRKLSRQFIRWKRPINSIIQRPRLWADQVDWSVVKQDVAQWGLEVVVEGFIANFATHYLFGIPFTVPTVLAHGMIITQG